MKKLLLTLLLITLPFASFADWELIDTYQFSDVNLNTNPKTFNNLQGDKYDYRVVIRLDGNTSNGALQLYFNDDDGVTDTNYRQYIMYGTGTTATIVNNNAVANIQICNCGDTAGLYSGFSDIYILGERGDERIVEVLSGVYTGNVPYILKTNGSFKTTADEITKINIMCSTSINTSGAFYLFRRLKTGKFNTSDWDLIEEVEVSSQNLNTSPIDFINLQGDKDIEYRLEAEFNPSAVCNLYVLLQTAGVWDETLTNYVINEMYNNGSVVDGANDNRPVDLGRDAGIGDNSAIVHIMAESGRYPVMDCQSYSFNGSGIKQMHQGVWHLSTDEITGIRIKDPTGSKTFTGKFRLYKRSKNRSSYGKRKIYEYNLNGDFSAGDTLKNIKDDKLYEVEIDFTANGSMNFVNLLLNDETSYQYQTLFSNSGTISASTGTYTFIQGARAANLNYTSNLRCLLMPKNTGHYRPVIISENGPGTTFITGLYAWWWKNDSDDLTDITFKGQNSVAVYGKIRVYEIDLK